MSNMKQYDADPLADDENAKDRPKNDPVVDLFPDDEADERNSEFEIFSEDLSLGRHHVQVCIVRKQRNPMFS